MTIARQQFGEHRLKAGIVEPQRTSIAEQQFGNHVPATTNSNERVHLLGNGSVSTFPWQQTEWQLIIRDGALYSVLSKL
jgi:hypothetical protein